MGNKMQDDEFVIPQHIAIIMDGNGRWAKKRFMPRNYGHAQGSKVLEKICEDAFKLGVKYLTVYAFSTENWVRPQEEIETLIKLFRNYMVDAVKTSKENDMRVRVIGDTSKFDDDLQEKIKILEESSKNNQGLNFQVALNYGGRDELLRAIKQIASDVKEGKIMEEAITDETVSQYLDTKEIPDPDLLIRTSGEQRLSNFMLWQLSYSEIYFTNTLWPDFNRDELIKAIEYYNGRDRRFGGV